MPDKRPQLVGPVRRLGLIGGYLEVVEVQRQRPVARTLPHPEIEHARRSAGVPLLDRSHPTGPYHPDQADFEFFAKLG